MAVWYLDRAGRTSLASLAELLEVEGSTGDAVQLADLARVSPLASAHVIPSGTYRFPKARAA